MTKKLIAIVLGGTNPHIALIENLKRRGYHTILIDYYENPPAKKAAAEHIRESTLDQKTVLRIAKEREADLVISTCIDQANVTACYVAEKLGLLAPYSYETAREVTDKILMKKKMIEGGIPTSRYLCLEQGTIFDETKLRFPVVVKPADGYSSKGVRRASNEGELKLFLKEAFSISRSNKAIVEEFVEGKEIGMDCFVHSNRTSIIMMHRKRKPLKRNEDVIYSIGSISPPELTDYQKKELTRITEQIAKVFKLNNTPLLIQVVVNGESINVVEFAPRIGGGLNFRTIKLFTGFDIINAAVDSFLGLPVNVEFSSPDFYHSENHIYAYPGKFGRLEGYQNLLESKIIEEIYFNKARGMELNQDMASSNRVGSFFVKAESKEELKSKIRNAINALQVFDVEGKMITRKDIYQNLLI